MVDISRARIWKSVDHLNAILCSTLLWAKVCLEDWPAEGQSIDSNAEFDEMRNLIWTIYLYKDMPPPYPHPKYNSGLWNNLDEFGHLQWQWLSRYITKYLKKQVSFLSVNTENSEKQTNHWPIDHAFLTIYQTRINWKATLLSFYPSRDTNQPISAHIWFKLKHSNPIKQFIYDITIFYEPPLHVKQISWTKKK